MRENKYRSGKTYSQLYENAYIGGDLCIKLQKMHIEAAYISGGQYTTLYEAAYISGDQCTKLYEDTYISGDQYTNLNENTYMSSER